MSVLGAGVAQVTSSYRRGPCLAALTENTLQYIKVWPQITAYAVTYRQMMKRASYRDPLKMIYLKPIPLSFLLNICRILSAPGRFRAANITETTFQQLQYYLGICYLLPGHFATTFFFSLICWLNYIDALYNKKGIIYHWKITKTSSDILPLYRNLI